ncbi:MAG: hypothetical protein ACI8XM_001539 [Haloarculaceae archaeon]|jgi:hypothetical protein
MDQRAEELLSDLATQLEATEELPVDRTAGRWIGEAQAVAADLTQGDPDTETVRRRVDHVVDLLDNVDDAGHSDTNERVATARTLAIDLREHLDSL